MKVLQREIWENSIETVYYSCKTDDHCKFGGWSRALKAGDLGQPRGKGGEGGGGSGCGDTCTHMGDSRQCMAKSTITLQRNYPPIKTYLFLKKKEVESATFPEI